MMDKRFAFQPEPDESLTAALLQEQQDLLELALIQDAEPPELEQEPQKKKLKRELAREALNRMEDAARTQSDFEEVIKIWDRLEQNEVRRVGNHEVSRGEIPLEWGMQEDGVSFPRSPNSAIWQAQQGDFLEMLCNCPYEIHELVEDPDISNLLFQLKDGYKEILYYWAVRMYGCAEIAAIRGQTDRNIRKARAALLEKLRKGLKELLKNRIRRNLPVTNSQRAFLARTEKIHP